VLLLPKDAVDEDFDVLTTGEVLAGRLGNAEPIFDIAPVPNPTPPPLPSKSATNGAANHGPETDVPSWQYVEKLLHNFEKTSKTKFCVISGLLELVLICAFCSTLSAKSSSGVV
jgi:hypothetical protein